MRGILVLTLIMIGAAWALRNPSVGVLVWTWVSIMNPHRLTWNIENFPVAAIVAIATLLGFLFTKDKKHFFLTAPSVALMLFVLWVCITYVFSFYREESTEMLSKVLKVDFMIFIAMFALYTKRHIMALVWVLVLSLGFFGVKGGLFTLATGGSHRVWGPAGTFIGGNNEIALALVMIIPLMFFLREQAGKLWQRHLWLAAMGLTAVAAIGSQSRGALVAIAAMLILLWIRGRQKLLFGILLVVGGIFLLAFMPESWHARMDTIGEYQQDASAMGRIHAWTMAWNVAIHNFFGGGFAMYTRASFAIYAPDSPGVHVAHSIYFSVLGEHGFVGLGLYLTIWILTWRWANWLRINAHGHPNTEWAATLGAMCQVSLVGYAVGGAFLSLAYFDLPYNMLVLVVLARRWVEAEGIVPRKQKSGIKSIKGPLLRRPKPG